MLYPFGSNWRILHSTDYFLIAAHLPASHGFAGGMTAMGGNTVVMSDECWSNCDGVA
jgi:hypothetical protein